MPISPVARRSAKRREIRLAMAGVAVISEWNRVTPSVRSRHRAHGVLGPPDLASLFGLGRSSLLNELAAVLLESRRLGKQTLSNTARQQQETDKPQLAATLGLFDATMIVMGGVIGSGIFLNPAVVARHLHSPVLILCAWLAGGVLALLGAMIYAELGAILPKAGGSYAYLHDGFHPLLGFLYGW